MSSDSHHTEVTAGTHSENALLLVRLGDRQYGLPLGSVERVLPMAHVPSLPDVGQGLMGMLNLHGQVLPVVDPRARLGLPTPAVAPEHRLVLLGATSRFLLWVDEVDEVVSPTEEELSSVPVQQASPIVPRVLRLGPTVVPVLAPHALEPRGSLR
jgi:purine-binding chemotaxis protein CheW